MRSSQMEIYFWSSVLYYIVFGVASIAIIISTDALGISWTIIAVVGYITLIYTLNIWRRRRHPRSVYQIKLAQRRSDD
ncbi:MAG: hypothetical protein E5V41_29390 [Mesorhizobium sp.]|nr:MAG: hypothetical protein E5V41_29390 [Mesorhizobium sp.]